MSASGDLQEALEELLAAPGALRVGVPLIQRRTKDLANDVEAVAAAQGGLCIYVLPPLPTEATSSQGANVVFFNKVQVRVRIVEIVPLNATGADAYDLIDDVATALHWQPKQLGTKLGAILAYPLELADRPTEAVEGVVGDGLLEGQLARVIDVIFNAVYGLQIS